MLFAPELFGEGNSRVHGGFRLGTKGHSRLSRGAIALALVAPFAGNNYVVPGVFSAL